MLHTERRYHQVQHRTDDRRTMVSNGRGVSQSQVTRMAGMGGLLL
jgi:hypothetical protein